MNILAKRSSRLRSCKLARYIAMIAIIFFISAQLSTAQTNTPNAHAASNLKSFNAGSGFDAPFQDYKALNLLFAPPDQEGISSWKASPEVIKMAEIEAGPMAITRVAGYKEYPYSEDLNEIFVLFETNLDEADFLAPVIGAALFVSDGTKCSLKWFNPALTVFGGGHEPLQPEFVMIGQGKHGALISVSNLHQGLFATTALLMAVTGDKVVVASEPIQTYGDNEGAAIDESEYYSFTGTISFHPTPEEEYYLMKVTTSGTMLIRDWETGEETGIEEVNYVENWIWNSQISAYELEPGC